MTSIQSLEQLQRIVADTPYVLVYFSRPDCGVCTALKPKVKEIVAELDGVDAYYVDLDQIPEAAGEYSIFTIPGILVFVDGRETIREARYVATDDLSHRMHRLHDLRFAG